MKFKTLKDALIYANKYFPVFKAAAMMCGKYHFYTSIPKQSKHGWFDYGTCFSVDSFGITIENQPKNWRTSLEIIESIPTDEELIEYIKKHSKRPLVMVKNEKDNDWHGPLHLILVVNCFVPKFYTEKYLGICSWSKCRYAYDYEIQKLTEHLL